jgi:hypothetical protein
VIVAIIHSLAAIPVLVPDAFPLLPVLMFYIMMLVVVFIMMVPVLRIRRATAKACSQ